MLPFLFLIFLLPPFFFLFFFNDTATTEIYTLSLHDALPICHRDRGRRGHRAWLDHLDPRPATPPGRLQHPRSEEHTSELQSPCNLVCRLLLEKKKKHIIVQRARCTTEYTTHYV